jgi:cell wall-associated NlpC family hydrolase
MTATSAPAAPVLDRRRHAFRDDLAAAELEGRVAAERFSDGVRMQLLRPSVPLRRLPGATYSLETEVLFGEIVTVFDVAEGWAWGQLERDRYVGYLPVEALTRDVTPATHRVRSPGTFVYPASDIKSPPLMHLSIGADLAVTDLEGAFARLTRGGYVVTRHIAEIGRHARDFVAVAEQLVGTPYLWGGRTRIGIDCSGLVQTALTAAGFSCPRDTDMQQAEVGTAIPIPRDLDGLERGDLVFWKGHVGVMTDSVMLLHANAHHMAVVIEPLPEAARRIERAGSAIVAIKRLPADSRADHAAGEPAA